VWSDTPSSTKDKKMYKRKKMKRSKSRKQFAKTAMSVKPRNFTKPMRGGIRL
jgi:hypothetical protein